MTKNFEEVNCRHILAFYVWYSRFHIDTVFTAYITKTLFAHNVEQTSGTRTNV